MKTWYRCKYDFIKFALGAKSAQKQSFRKPTKRCQNSSEK